MTAERFMALAAAYGADLRRWPEAERMAAEAYLAASPETARPALAEADGIDELLFASARPVPSAALRERVVASAARVRLKAAGAGRRWLERMVLLLGAGWAAAACAGVAAGVLMTTHLTADAQADAVLYQASLSTVDDTEVLG
jgi:hypothetical protein